MEVATTRTTNFIPAWVLFIAIAVLVACTKEPKETPLTDVLKTWIEGSAIADSSTTITLVAQLTKEADANKRNITFRVARGNFINPSGQVVGGNTYRVEADAEGYARIAWRGIRLAGTEYWSAMTEDTTYRIESTFRSDTAYPSRIVLSSPTAQTDSVITISANLFRDNGYYSRGLPLTFRAWRHQNGMDVDVANFASSPVQLTNASATHSITLNLSGPGVPVSPDTCFVGASCGTLQSENVLYLRYTP